MTWPASSRCARSPGVSRRPGRRQVAGDQRLPALPVPPPPRAGSGSSSAARADQRAHQVAEVVQAQAGAGRVPVDHGPPAGAARRRAGRSRAWRRCGRRARGSVRDAKAAASGARDATAAISGRSRPPRPARSCCDRRAQGAAGAPPCRGSRGNTGVTAAGSRSSSSRWTAPKARPGDVAVLRRRAPPRARVAPSTQVDSRQAPPSAAVCTRSPARVGTGRGTTTPRQFLAQVRGRLATAGRPGARRSSAPSARQRAAAPGKTRGVEALQEPGPAGRRRPATTAWMCPPPTGSAAVSGPGTAKCGDDGGEVALAPQLRRVASGGGQLGEAPADEADVVRVGEAEPLVGARQHAHRRAAARRSPRRRRWAGGTRPGRGRPGAGTAAKPSRRTPKTAGVKAQAFIEASDSRAIGTRSPRRVQDRGAGAVALDLRMLAEAGEVVVLADGAHRAGHGAGVGAASRATGSRPWPRWPDGRARPAGPSCAGSGRG